MTTARSLAQLDSDQRYRGCVANRATSALTIPTSTETAVIFQQPDTVDTDDMHDTSTNPTRITVPADVDATKDFGRIIANANVSALATNGRAYIVIKESGAYLSPTVRSEVQVGTSAVGAFHASLVSPLLVLTPGNYYEVYVFQDSGGNESLLDASFELQIIKVID